MGVHHDHPSGPGESALGSHRGRLLAALVLASVYLVAEVVGGLLTGSLALLADAAHMLSDVAALGLSLFAVWMARRPPTPRRTFGFYRTEILAALVNGATLLTISVFILLEAFERWQSPQPVASVGMMAIAAGGLVVNLIGLWLLSSGRRDSLNMRGAWLHLLTDTLGSVQALVAGALIWAWGWLWADPLASAMIALLVVYSAWNLMSEAVSVLMEGVPRHIELEEVRRAILETPGVESVHDLHVWTITSGLEALSAHVVPKVPESGELLPRIRSTLRQRFGIDHQTIQVDPAGSTERCSGACS